MHAAGCRVALTSAGLDKRENFFTHVREAIERGLPRSAALAALTTVPASILGLEERLGTIAKGKIASFVVCDGDFSKTAR